MKFKLDLWMTINRVLLAAAAIVLLFSDLPSWSLIPLEGFLIFLIVLFSLPPSKIFGLSPKRLLAFVISVSVLIFFGILLLVAPAMIMIAMPAPSEPTLPSTEYGMKLGAVTMRSYSIEGPVDYNGMKATRITAEQVEISGQKMGGLLKMEAESVALENVEMYVTYMRGTGSTMGMRVQSGWMGDQSPPWTIGLLGDPTTFTDVTMHVVKIHAGTSTSEGMGLE